MSGPPVGSGFEPNGIRTKHNGPTDTTPPTPSNDQDQAAATSDSQAPGSANVAVELLPAREPALLADGEGSPQVSHPGGMEHRREGAPPVAIPRQHHEVRPRGPPCSARPPAGRPASCAGPGATPS